MGLEAEVLISTKNTATKGGLIIWWGRIVQALTIYKENIISKMIVKINKL